MKRCTALVVGGLGVFVGMNCTPFGEAEPLNGDDAGAAYVGATPDAGDAGSQDAATPLDLDGAPSKACSDRAPLLSANFDLGPLEIGWNRGLDTGGGGEGWLDPEHVSPPNSFYALTTKNTVGSQAFLSHHSDATTDAIALSFRVRVLAGGTVDRVRLAQVKFRNELDNDYSLMFFLREGKPFLEEYRSPDIYERYELPKNLGRDKWASVELEVSLTAKTASVRVDGTELWKPILTPPYSAAPLGLEIGLIAYPNVDGGTLTAEDTDVLFDDVVLRDCGQPK